MSGEQGTGSAPKARASDGTGVGNPGVGGSVSSSSLTGGAGAKPPVAKKSKISITVDTEPKDVVELDQKGFLLIFDHEVERFRELPDEVVQELGYENRVNYGVARGVFLALKKDGDRPFHGIEILPPMAASAGRRLEVTGLGPGMHACWKRPDELVQAGMLGYKIVQGGGVQTFAQKGDGTHRVGAFGKDELILMEIPQEKFEAIEAEAGAKSRALIENQSNKSEDAIRAAGGVPFKPKDNDGVAWRDLGVEGGQ